LPNLGSGRMSRLATTLLLGMMGLKYTSGYVQELTLIIKCLPGLTLIGSR
jgi:hypothetical protein